MSAEQQAFLVAASAIASAAYMAPTLIGVALHGTGTWRILAVNALLGWTVLGWLWALKLALTRPAKQIVRASEWAPWSPGRPEAPRPPRASSSTYDDGTYLISEAGSARTWAVCTAGRWGIAFELDGIQRMAAWVDSCDVPVEVLACALAGPRQGEHRT